MTKKSQKPQLKKHRATKSKHNYNDEGIYTVADTKIIGNVWEIANVKNDSKHPAIFPFELAEKHIQTWSNENDFYESKNKIRINRKRNSFIIGYNFHHRSNAGW